MAQSDDNGADSRANDRFLQDADNADMTFYGSPLRWKFRRLGACGLSYSVFERDGELVTAANLGSIVEDVVRPLGWNFTNAPRPRKDPRHPHFQDHLTASLVLPDSTRVRQAIDVVRSETQRLTHFGTQPVLADAAARGSGAHQLRMDYAGLTKFTVQVGSIGDWFVSRQGGAPRPAVLDGPNAGLFDQVVTHVCKVYGAAMPARKHWSPKAPPATTNSGFPFFGKHQLLKLGGTLIADTTVEQTIANGVAVCARLELNPALAFCAGVASRSGPLGKKVEIRRFTGSGWVKRGLGQGWRQRERVVQMAAPAVNKKLEMFYCGLHEARKAIPGLWHAGSADRQLAMPLTYSYECDISGYDTSVPRDIQELMAAKLKAHCPALTADDLNAFLWSETLPLVTPNWQLNSDLASIVSFRGGTRSGLRHTAEIGTIIAVTVTLYSLARQNRDWKSWPHMDGTAVLHQGDDALVCSSEPLDADVWKETYAECGFTATLIPSDVFLARHQRASQGVAPKLDRLIQQTLSNEKETTGPETLALGIQALGLLGRCEGVQFLHPEAQAAAWRMMQAAAWIERHQRPGTRSLPEFISQLRNDSKWKEAIARSLKWKQGEGWFAQVIRDAEHSPVARAVADEAEARGADIGVATALDRRVAAATDAALQLMSWPERLDLITRIQAAKSDGPKAMDDLFNETTTRLIGIDPALAQNTSSDDTGDDDDD